MSKPDRKPVVHLTQRGKGAGDDSSVDLVQPVLNAARLFGQQRELLIEHAGMHYRLRITQNNKLILTK